ncbi:MAG: sigma-70 family RNA polymerase sigma factor [Vicinamibacterales bacterium]
MDVTGLLDRWGRGDREAFGQLVPLVYDELRQLAQHYLKNERSDHTLQPTALIHEAYLRLTGLREMRFENRAHFYGAAAQAMRRVLVDHARRHQSDKRGGGDAPVPLPDDLPDGTIDLRLDVVALNVALESFERIAPDKARVVELRYFGGLSVEETAECLGLSPATVKRYWAFSRAWLFRALEGPATGTAAP